MLTVCKWQREHVYPVAQVSIDHTRLQRHPRPRPLKATPRQRCAAECPGPTIEPTLIDRLLVVRSSTAPNVPNFGPNVPTALYKDTSWRFGTHAPHDVSQMQA